MVICIAYHVARDNATHKAENFHGITIYFKGRNFRGQKLSRDEKNANCLTKTFANDGFWDKFRGKKLSRKGKKSSFSREKTFANGKIQEFFFDLIM